jgi:hypothetical protein
MLEREYNILKIASLYNSMMDIQDCKINIILEREQSSMTYETSYKQVMIWYNPICTLMSDHVGRYIGASIFSLINGGGTDRLSSSNIKFY